MKKATLIVLGILVVIATMSLTACGGPSQADVAAKNLSTQAEQFKVARDIIGINGITDKYLWQIRGFCSVETTNSALGGSLEVTCKTGVDANGHGLYKKLYFGLSDNVTYVVQQIDPINVSTRHYTVIFRPETLIPDIDKG